MNKEKIKKHIIMLILLLTPNIAYATEYIKCGDDRYFPYALVNLVSIFFTIIKIAVPILLVISGMITFLKVTFSSNVDEDMKKAKSKLINNIIAAVIIFFIISIINFAIGLVAGANNKFMSCVNCFINPDKCEKIDKEDNEIKPGIIGNNKKTIKEYNGEEEKKEGEVIEQTNKNPKIENINGVTYVNGILIVNKTYSIPKSYKPSNAGNNEYCNSCLTQETMNAFEQMQSDMAALGLNIYISSGFRSYSYQDTLYNNYVNKDGKAAADTYSARPGHSEHQTGLAFDLNTIDDSFANTAEGKWIEQNCWQYGLILRYPKGKENKTGYKYESWHLRYIGKDLAQTLYNNGNWITLEEYFNLTSKYNNE